MSFRKGGDSYLQGMVSAGLEETRLGELVIAI